MRGLLFIIMAGWFVGARAATNDSVLLTVEEAVSRALTHNRAIAAAELDLNGRAMSAEQARYQFAFNLAPVADALVRSSSDSFRYGLVGSQQLEFGTEIETGVRADQVDPDNADRTRAGYAYVQVTQPLFRDWGTLVNREGIESADSRTIAARRVLELRKQDIVLQVIETCQGLLRLQRLAADEQRSIERYDRLLRLTRAKEKQGRATPVDSLRIALLKGQAEARKATAEEQRIALQADFANLLGADSDQRWMPAERDDLRIARPDRDTAIAIAISNRLDLAQAYQDYTDAQRGLRIARRNLLPDLSLVGRYERFDSGPDWSEAWAFDEDGWVVGLSADSDLLLRDERLGVRQAALGEQGALLRIADADALVRRQVDQALSACRRADSDQDIAARNLDLATRRANLAQRLFEKGRVDHTSATDAEIELLDARTQWLNARAESEIAGYRLLRAMGLLVEAPDELKPHRTP